MISGSISVSFCSISILPRGLDFSDTSCSIQVYRDVIIFTCSTSNIFSLCLNMDRRVEVFVVYTGRKSIQAHHAASLHCHCAVFTETIGSTTQTVSCLRALEVGKLMKYVGMLLMVVMIFPHPHATPPPPLWDDI